MADFEAKLRWLSERGDPVGAEELIERIEANMAGDPLVVVAKRREGPHMTKTESRPTEQPSRYRGPAWALVAFAAIVGFAAVLFIAFSGGDDPVASPTPTTQSPQNPTTVTPETPTTQVPAPEPPSGRDVIEAGVAAFYSGDGEQAAELFELEDRTDDEIRAESAYQAAIGGRLTLNCRETATPEAFSCNTPYHNSLTDAIGFVDNGDTGPVVIEDGVITEFGFPEHSWMVIEIGTFLAIEGDFDGYEECVFGPFAESCATIQLENLDAWVEWRQTFEPADAVESALARWYAGECEPALFLGGGIDEMDDCPSPADAPSSSPIRTIEYESILGAEVSVDDCQVLVSGESSQLSCQVSYSNAMNDAVDKPPAVMTREFSVWSAGIVDTADGERAWWQDDYPEDTELRESFRRFAEEGDLATEYGEAGCASARTEDCAHLIVDNLDDWAAWYQTQG